MLIPVTDPRLREQLELVKNLVLSEVNVKKVEYIYDTKDLVTRKIKPNFKTLGKKYGKQMKEISNAFLNFTQKQILEIEESDEYRLQLSSGDVVIEREDREIISEDMPGWLVAVDGKLTLALDVTVSESLRREGVARELVNRIQNIRKENRFEVTDKIKIFIQNNKVVEDALDEYRDYICNQTLAVAISLTGDMEGATMTDWEEETLAIRLERI